MCCKENRENLRDGVEDGVHSRQCPKNRRSLQEPWLWRYRGKNTQSLVYEVLPASNCAARETEGIGQNVAGMCTCTESQGTVPPLYCTYGCGVWIKNSEGLTPVVLKTPATNN